MAKKLETRTFNVAVVGLSGTEKEKGTCGIGKSCLCNRFMRPHADEYYTDHISVLSQSDFGGRVVNNDHFLYWGEVTKTSDEGQDFTFHVIEQTEFIDDTSFQPFKGGKTEPYYKRCASVKIQSAEKLMYICKNQLGLENDHEQKFLPEGKMTIDGFLCLFDVSIVHQRPIERQVEYTALILNNILKVKKPVVLVTTKNDQMQEPYVREAEKLFQRKDLAKMSIPIVETSAHSNVNIELAFLTLAHLIDRTKGRPKTLPYFEAARARKERLDVAIEAFQHLIRSHVTDYKTVWLPVLRQIKADSDFLLFVELFGTDQAKKLFQKHIRSLKEEFVQQRKEFYIRRLKQVLQEILPNLTVIADRSWPNILRWLQRQDFFDDYFVMLPEDLPWQCSDLLESTDDRIPFDLLECGNEADNCYRNHVNALRLEYKRLELRKQFKQLLEDNHNVCPGKSLNEVAIFFLGRECFSILSEDDKQSVYEQHQKELRENAKVDFLELLHEHAELFARFEPHGEVTTLDFKEINERLQHEQRYRALHRIEDDRKVILFNHLGFLQKPSKEHCPFNDFCMESLIQEVLDTKARRPQSWSRNSAFILNAEDNRLNLVLLGNHGLSDQLAREIRLQCVEDEYTLDGQIYSLDYRPIDGDVGLPQNSFRTTDFLPHGCFCVYNSIGTLEYIRESLEKTLLSDLQREDRLPFQGLPIVIVLAHDPDVTEKGLAHLREEGQLLSERLQCPFIDTPSSMMVDDSKRFHEAQIGLAMHKLAQSIQHRSTFVTPWETAESIEPDIRILMCFMCGDPFNVDLPLAPLLNHQCCYVTSDKFPTITLETYLDESKRKVEVTVVSYHGATLVRDELYHGFILVYSAKRQASLTTLSAFAGTIPPLVPTKILAITESGGANAFFSNGHSQALLTEGNTVADRIGASFMTTCSNFHTQIASYTPFFKEAWEKKTMTESAFSFGTENVVDQTDKFLERLRTRPPAMLPKPPTFETFGLVPKGSTSNSQSTEDSEPIYDQPHFERCHSDSDHDRASSASPPPTDGLYSTVDIIAYSDNHHDTDPLIKPASQGKSKRSMYAEQYRKSYPSASGTSSFASSYKEESTDTDSSVRSPKIQRQRDRFDGEPHYQFRKSNSMKLALREGLEGFNNHATPAADNKLAAATTERKLQKSSTLPYSSFTMGKLKGTQSQDSGWYEGNAYDPKPDPGPWGENLAFEVQDRDKENRKCPPPPKPKPPLKPKPLDSHKFADVRQILSRNMAKANKPQQPLLMVKAAPLATPEPIEIGDYAQVKDALYPAENDYALVHDALPAGKVHKIRSTVKKNQDSKGTDSDSEFSSLEKDKKTDDIYSRVNRRPTPHKKKHKPRHSDGSLPPPIPPYNEERHFMHSDHLEKVRRSQSPSEGSEGTGDELQSFRKARKKRSIRSKKSKAQDNEATYLLSPPWSDSETGPSPSKGSVGEDCLYESISPRDLSNSPGRGIDEGVDELDDVGWRRKLRLTSQKDPEKQKKKEERKAKEEERKKLKEEERKMKEQQKIQRKMKKKDSRSGPHPQSQLSCAILEDLIQSEENYVPYFVEKCVTFIEEEGLTWEGIYRVPGNKVHVDLLAEKFKEDPLVSIRELDIPVNAVATALKGFFFDLSEPLLPNYLYDELTEAISICDKSARIFALRGLMKKLPHVNHEVLKYLITHIYKVSQYSSQNQMDSKNLAICWWPTLLRPEFTTFEKMTMATELLQEIVVTLIDQHGFFFYGHNEV